mmetsp:Transcript_29830/g.26375  ORF Transcript_29830/g.26375 Transcript_29830/m.26375 type:complete len:359 (-) Transcript_29830:79-1155(-)|eukprot:CAMPEP_0201591442 /NCGR_PEP_ID=MMETSP0190_2-20130828/189497_1 /ASSEMBLY_ACC=CAM_ASM_000263 /TAXON_ID=37353 /ORGANISM="Rosalina sp." /LENGTH=358 /DNA_ID=CAMNT_0048049753 /DNA_START=92 /DNA_END=1168 /DNA_ORIENTATION=-
MQALNLVAVLFVLLIMITAGVYASKRNVDRDAIRGVKQLRDSDSDDVTDTEPELEMQQKEVDKMDLIPEENDDQSQPINAQDDDEKSPNPNKKTKPKRKRRKSSGDAKEDEIESSDSEEYSMQRMVEEYQKSRTLAKKFAEIIEDISDTFKRKSIEIKRKFEPEAPPAVVKPMSFAEMQAKLQQSKSSKPQSKVKVSKKKKKSSKDEDEDDIGGKNESDSDEEQQDFEVNFDDEKEKEQLLEQEQEHEMEAQEIEKEKDEEVDMIDSADEFGEFNEQNFEQFEDFDTEKMEENNGAIEIVVNNEQMNKNNINMDKQEKDHYSDSFDGGAAIEIPIEDEKVKEDNEEQVLMNEENVIEI